MNVSMTKDLSNNIVDELCVDTIITGNIETVNDLRIDGVIEGDIVTLGRVVVGERARVHGNIKCSNIDVLGIVQGDICSSGIVVLKMSANVSGNILTEIISIDPGAVFNGRCSIIE